MGSDERGLQFCTAGNELGATTVGVLPTELPEFLVFVSNYINLNV